MLDRFPGVRPAQQAEHGVVKLLEEALKLFDRDLPAARRRIEDACKLAAGDNRSSRAKNGLLADWQLQRADRYICQHLDSRLRIGAVARTVNLSPSYFSRAFKATKGVHFSDFVLMSRITLAKHLLSTTDRPIAQIALQCGLADQSHLTRIFHRAVGAPPGAWRSRRIADLQISDDRKGERDEDAR